MPSVKSGHFLKSEKGKPSIPSFPASEPDHDAAWYLHSETKDKSSSQKGNSEKTFITKQKENKCSGNIQLSVTKY